MTKIRRRLGGGGRVCENGRTLCTLGRYTRVSIYYTRGKIFQRKYTFYLYIYNAVLYIYKERERERRKSPGISVERPSGCYNRHFGRLNSQLVSVLSLILSSHNNTSNITRILSQTQIRLKCSLRIVKAVMKIRLSRIITTHDLACI